MSTTALPAETSTPTRRRFTVEEYCAMVDAGILAEDERVKASSDLVDGVYQNRRIVPADATISPIAFPDVALTVGDFLLGDPGSEGDETGTAGTDS